MCPTAVGGTFWRDSWTSIWPLPITAQRAAVLAALGPEFAAQAALLNVVFSAQSAGDGGSAGGHALNSGHSCASLCWSIFCARATAGRPLLVSIDDAHWLDEESWLLVEAAVRDVRGLCLVLAMQPLEDDTRLQRLEAAGARRLRLGELSDEDQERSCWLGSAPNG